MKNTYNHIGIFRTELGGEIPNPEFVYHTFGKLNKEKNNVVWICHALTANSDVSDWWDGMVGTGKFYDPEKYFIVCANYIGSCYGTTGPLSVNTATGKPWFRSFPAVTVRDMVQGLEIVRQHLGIENIHTIVGGSIGGFQAIEWAISNPGLFRNTVLIACNEKISPWAVAFNESQRLAILADPTFAEDRIGGGNEGLKAARSMALLSYRNGKAYNLTQSEDSNEVTGNFRASSYQRYQGEKLVNRFDAYTYFLLSGAIDSHNVARGRGSVSDALKKITSKTIVIGITSDILFPKDEPEAMASLIPGAVYRTIESEFGHDGFLIESEQLYEILSNFYNS